MTAQPNFGTFKKLAKKGNLIPIYREVLADLETPVSSFLKVVEGGYSFLLESAEGPESVARYSFLGSKPFLIFRSYGKTIEVEKKGLIKRWKTKRDPLRELEQILRPFRFVYGPDLPRFCGGAVGYMGYDVVRFFERLPDKKKTSLPVPDMLFMLTDTILIFDHLKRTIKVVSNAHLEGSRTEGELKEIYELTLDRIEQVITRLKERIEQNRAASESIRPGHQNVQSNVRKEYFKKSVLKAKRYIQQGDIIQAVLSQRFETDITSSPFDIYRTLRTINPSPYLFYLNCGSFQLIGSSPEIHVRCEGEDVSVRPIAGTRRRGKTEMSDRKLAKELLKDPKERAEHLMLVDLARNDIGRVCRLRSIKVTELMVIEYYSHVMHLVSHVQGKLAKDKNVFDLIRTTFPAGTVTGAPKIRAMEIIDELETSKRGIYSGLVGYFSFSGNFDSCITIRTILVRQKKAYVQAGAGIVADSIPENEYTETKNKAQALIRAIQLAEEGVLK